MGDYNVAEALGSINLRDVREKLEDIKKLTGKDGNVFIDVLVNSSAIIDPRLLNEYGEEDNFSYAVSLQALVTELYPDTFGFDFNSIWNGEDYCDFDELLKMCYVYITTYMTSEKEFLDDLMLRITSRNLFLIKKLAEARKESFSKIKEISVNDEKGINSLFETEDVTLESANPALYDDLTISCLVLNGDDVDSYISLMPNNEKIVASDTGVYSFEPCIYGGTIKTQETVMVDGREYITNRQENEITDYLDNTIDDEILSEFNGNASLFDILPLDDSDEDEFDGFVADPYKTPIVVRNMKNPNSSRFMSSEDFIEHYETNEYRDYCYSIDEPREYVQIADNTIINGTLVLEGSYVSIDEYGTVISVVDGNDFSANYSIVKDSKVKSL